MENKMVKDLLLDWMANSEWVNSKMDNSLKKLCKVNNSLQVKN